MTSKHGIPGFLASEHTPPPLEEARFHILPVPFERTVSYGGGTALGPAAILEASQQLEVYDGYCDPSSLGICTHDAVCRGVDAEEMLAEVRQKSAAILGYGGLPVLLGGEHTVTFGAVQACCDRGEPFGVIQFDAHADLRDAYEGSPWSHACVMRRIVDRNIPILQLGVRSLSPAEVDFRRQRAIPYVDAHAIMRHGLPDNPVPSDFPERVYVTVDIDVLDASVMPATGTPEPGGLDWYRLMDALETCLRGRTVVGCDLVEFAPIPNFHAYDFTAARLLYNLFGIIMRAAPLAPAAHGAATTV